MTPEAFRRHGHEIVDWIADYWQGIESRDVVPGVEPGELRRALPTRAPEAAEPFEAILEDVERLIVPGMAHWGHPGWFAYFPSNASPPSVLGEMLAAGPVSPTPMRLRMGERWTPEGGADLPTTWATRR